jgi:phage tail-like protein
MTSLEASAQKKNSNRVDHAADYYSRYPGETVVFYTRVDVDDALVQFTARITLAPGLALVNAKAAGRPGGGMPAVTIDEGTTMVIWNVERPAAGPCRFEFQTEVSILAVEKDCMVESTAVLSAEPNSGMIYLQKPVAVAVKAQGRLMQYLPSIYHEDGLMARLLMLFDSFLAPIEKQINTQQYYLDPRMTPAQFLDWLASWLGLTLDPDISEQQRRKLVQEAARLYKLRGTRRGLVEYLEIISGGKVEIVEHFSENFRLGPESYMGPGIALGKENIPNTFAVKVLLSPLPDEVSEEEKKRNRLLWERKTQAIIDAEKPVHSGYDLSLDYDSRLG